MKPDIHRAKHNWGAKGDIAFHHRAKLGRDLWILPAVACEGLHLSDQIIRCEDYVGALARVAGRKCLLRVAPARSAKNGRDEFVLIHMRKVADLASQHEHQVERRFVAIELRQTAGARIMLRRRLASEKINWEWWA